MRTRIACILGIVLVWAAAYCRPVLSDDPTVHFPTSPVVKEPETPNDPTVIHDISVGELYVIESTEKPLLVADSREGFVSIRTLNGPLEFFAKFSDSIDRNQYESRTYSSQFIYVVQAQKSGEIELITSSDNVILKRILLTVTVGPRPPPIDPVDPVDPIEPTKSFRVIFVKESGSTLSAEQTAIPGAKVIRDYLNAKTTPEAGGTGWREYDPQQTAVNETPTMKKLWDTVKPQIQSIPCMIIEVNGHATIKPFPANVDECVKILKEYGG